MSRSESSRDVSVTISSVSTSSGRSPVRSTSVPPCGAINLMSVATLMLVTPAGIRAALLEVLQDQLRALLGLVLLGVDAHVGIAQAPRTDRRHR